MPPIEGTLAPFGGWRDAGQLASPESAHRGVARRTATFPPAKADLVLCSHVFYYLQDETWDETLRQLASWLAPGGILVVIMQNPDSDCMKLLRSLSGRRDSLRDLMHRLLQTSSAEFNATIDTVPCHIRAVDPETAYKVTEFIVSARPASHDLERSELQSYIESRFRLPDGNYRFFVHTGFPRDRSQPAGQSPNGNREKG